MEVAKQPAPGLHPLPKAWELIWPPGEYKADERRSVLVSNMLEFFTRQHDKAFYSTHRSISGSVTVAIDYMQLITCCDPNFAEALRHAPEVALQCLAVAASEHFYNLQSHIAHACAGSQRKMVCTRLVNVVDAVHLIRFSGLKPEVIGRHVSVRGTVVRMGAVTPKVTQMDFVCARCGTRNTRQFQDGKFKPPDKCDGDGCSGKKFEACRSEAVCVDWQKIRLQEVIGSDKQSAGQVPRTVEVELTDDLVGSCVVGDVVTVFAAVKHLAAGEGLGQFSAMDSMGGGGGGGRGGGRGGRGAAPKQQSLFLIYLEALSVLNVRGAGQGGSGSHQQLASAGQDGELAGLGGGRMLSQRGGGVRQGAEQTGSGGPPNMPPLTAHDLAFILQFTKECEGDQLRQLVHALAPAIYGHELVKAGLVLALLGGVRKNDGVSGRVPIRGDVHVLLVGDAGLGKSQLLQACASVAPRGIYVCGNTSSAVGLTASVEKDAVTGDFVLVAGAMVLGDRGCCCVDEFDKMTGEHQALLEAMEQQEVSLAKAGMVASLPARTTVLAAANPAGREGVFNKAKSVADNLKMSPAMLSRFDLVFIMMDRPDLEHDRCLSAHTLALHSGNHERVEEAKNRRLRLTNSEAPLLLPSPGSTAAGGGRQPLAQRLRMQECDVGELLPGPLIRKYIAYAREYVKPVLSDAAKERLQAFYMQLREQVAPGTSMPITARQLESLVRLAEARARVDLREEVTAQDAEDVIEIMREGLFDIFGGLSAAADNALGTVSVSDLRAATNASGARAGSKRAQVETFLAALRLHGARQGRDHFEVGELHAMASSINLQVKNMGVFIEQLNDAGELLKKGPGLYRVAGIQLGAGAAAGGAGLTQGGTQAGGLGTFPGEFGNPAGSTQGFTQPPSALPTQQQQGHVGRPKRQRLQPSMAPRQLLPNQPPMQFGEGDYDEVHGGPATQFGYTQQPQGQGQARPGWGSTQSAAPYLHVAAATQQRQQQQGQGPAHLGRKAVPLPTLVTPSSVPSQWEGEDDILQGDEEEALLAGGEGSEQEWLTGRKAVRQGRGPPGRPPTRQCPAAPGVRAR